MSVPGVNCLNVEFLAETMGWAFDTGKIVLTALIIFSIAQVSERSTLMAAVLASIPIVSVLSMMMMYHEGQTAADISGFAKDIVWLVIPSLLLFIVMPWLIESRSWDFYPALAAGMACTISGYFLMVQMMDRFGLTT
jgi:hypothetical protein|tara:strand:+ start:54 stop:464 length:411 start_codon:yes stop_codon:yes gene_type:complete